MKNIGLQLKKGWIVRVDGKTHEVARDNEWNADFGVWGSVELVGEYPPRFTHKGNIEIVSTNPIKRLDSADPADNPTLNNFLFFG